MNQAELAALSGVTRGAVTRYMNGERGLVGDLRTMSTIRAFARALDVEPEYFLEYRLCQIAQALRETPEISEQIYDLVMRAARFVREEKPQRVEP